MKNENYCSNCSGEVTGPMRKRARYTQVWYRTEVKQTLDGHFDGLHEVRHEWTYFYCSEDCRIEHVRHLTRTKEAV